MGIVRRQYLTGGNDFGYIVHKIFRFLCFMEVYQGITPNRALVSAKAANLAHQLQVNKRMIVCGGSAPSHGLWMAYRCGRRVQCVFDRKLFSAVASS